VFLENLVENGLVRLAGLVPVRENRGLAARVQRISPVDMAIGVSANSLGDDRGMGKSVAEKEVGEIRWSRQALRPEVAL
jgi:hypothetical protein